MEYITTKEEAKKAAEKSVNYYKVRIDAWEKVTRNYTKSGEPFKIISKNFNNCQIEPGEEIKIYFTDEENRITYDFISLRKNVYVEKATYQKEAETPEEIAERIADGIEKYKKWLQIDEKGAEEIEKQIDNLMPKLEEIKGIIDEAKETTNTHYILRGFIKNYLNII